MKNEPQKTAVLWLVRDDGDMTEPMNIMLLSALGKENRPWRSSHVGLLERDDISKLVRDLRPQIVAASVITGSHTYYLEAFGRIKKEFGNAVFTMLGGPYCSTYPEVIKEHPFIDAIGVFECDDAWPEFLDAFERNRDDIHCIPNIITRENCDKMLSCAGSVTVVDRQFYRDRRAGFDSLPYMDRALVYDNTAFRFRYKRTHMAGRGCPFRCTYCFERDWNEIYKGKGKMLQRYSPQRFCEELAWVGRHYDTRFWKFYDDVFPTFKYDMEWLHEFADVYPRMVGLPFHCLTRCDIVARNPEVLPLLKKAGIASLTMSIESGNAFIRDHIVMRDMTEEQIRRAFGLAKKLGIPTFSNTILGIPAPLSDKKGLHPHQLDYDRESCRFNIDLGVSFGEFPILHPYPRTAVTAYLMEKGWFDGDFDKLHASYQNRSPLSCFSEREKTIQQNLALLTTFCMLFSGSPNRILNYLSGPLAKICLDWLAEIPFAWATWLYEQLYTLSKSYMHEMRMYPFRKSVRERVRFWIEMAKLDIWKQFGHKPLLRGARPGQTLGGPPSV